MLRSIASSIKKTPTHSRVSAQLGLLKHSQRFFRASNAHNIEFNVFIDGKPIKVDGSYTIYQACTEAGVEIPRFCYHERLSVAGNCRMCLVEVEGSPKPIASCATQVRPDIKVITRSEKTRIARGGVMEFLLANHPLDCPICDQGGECDLQDISQIYGFNESRYHEYKRAVEDKNIGPLIKTSMTRCIHCTRCVRFTEQIAGEFTLGQVGRGTINEISTYVENMVTNELSGNVVDLCPVGALNNLPYSFKARPWELKSTHTIDVMDPLCAPTEAHTRGSDLLRILPRVNEEVNEEWISDKARHAFDGLKTQRLTVPMARKSDGSFAELTWEEAMKLASDKLKSVPAESIHGKIGKFSDIESVIAFKDLLNKLNSENVDVRANSPTLHADFRNQYLMNSRVTGIDETDLLVLVGCNPKFENPVLNARIKKAVSVNGLEVVIIGSAPQLPYNYTHIGNSTETLKQLAEGTHPFTERLRSADLPMVLVSSLTLERSDAPAIMNYINLLKENTNLISKEDQWNGFNVLNNDVGKINSLEVGVTTKNVSDLPPAKVVYLLGCDDFRHEEIPEDAFVIYQGHTGDEGALYADLILPSSSYLEKNGLFVNVDGRPQQTRTALSSPGFAQDDWMVLRALSEELGTPLPYDNLEELRTRACELAPHLIKYDFIESSGFEDFAHMPNGETQTNGTVLTENVDNFYMTDSISRNSHIMARCTRELNPLKQFNFKKDVQTWITH
uniref:NADH-ubiquinone oxidoreductase 75 kDa subunit, mitochondrial n=1 Tax=Strombidium rassoulzadegani TaxID=1082188 RepID=A0A7S3CKU0_9SPIT